MYVMYSKRGGLISRFNLTPIPNPLCPPPSIPSAHPQNPRNPNATHVERGSERAGDSEQPADGAWWVVAARAQRIKKRKGTVMSTVTAMASRTCAHCRLEAGSAVRRRMTQQHGKGRSKIGRWQPRAKP